MAPERKTHTNTQRLKVNEGAHLGIKQGHLCTVIKEQTGHLVLVVLQSLALMPDKLHKRVSVTATLPLVESFIGVAPD